MSRREPREEGFTLIEVLAATVILSVASMAMLAFFINAMSYNKGNQNKTVMVNLARNALFYMEKQNYATIHNYFIDPSTKIQKNSVISSEGCTRNICDKPDLQNLFLNPNMKLLWDVLNPKVNDIEYQISVSYQDKLTEELEKDPVKKGMANYLLPIHVEVSVKDNNVNNGRNKPVIVEGYIANESIR
ncbi:type II secretion system protein [Paenibacillus sp. CGMCC 1.16610]|uniref:Prepilin-type N-terminal cleavage/methylation domain-containing protein n=1 Tax=Paenibacillus anseongense TaxID=2682845 RepID=A0ABW9UFQ8_9BACL|nr:MULTISPECIES: type II secretion system protein [Paenibacillus]MBA2940042.1 type II secretion system protein [Paenibacillus sp. CGMCC 1.16610]MVQ38997.1 prepilin-type N-terminal cleavage/methylation domain-containing protein [Paenibacillus anseongense]